jgi:hypothetical protein
MRHGQKNIKLPDTYLHGLVWMFLCKEKQALEVCASILDTPYKQRQYIHVVVHRGDLRV